MSKKPTIQLDAFEAARLADEGLERAIKKANKRRKGWIDQAYAFFIQWLYKLPKNATFQIEDVRVASMKTTIAQPPNHRAWGGVAKRAANDNLIKKIGVGPTKSTTAHGANAAIYKKL